MSKKLIILDTSIIISSADNFGKLSDGKHQALSASSKAIISAMRNDLKSVEFIATRAIADEYIEKCTGAPLKGISQTRMPPTWLYALIDATLVSPKDDVTPKEIGLYRSAGLWIRDENDYHVIAAAHKFGAYIISADGDFSDAVIGQGKGVVTPKQILATFNEIATSNECCPNYCCPGVRACRNHGGGQ